jgi:hypothetical protein
MIHFRMIRCDPETDECSSNREFNDFMKGKILRTIVMQNFIEREEYQDLISTSIKAVHYTPYDPESSLQKE